MKLKSISVFTLEKSKSESVESVVVSLFNVKSSSTVVSSLVLSFKSLSDESNLKLAV